MEGFIFGILRYLAADGIYWLDTGSNEIFLSNIINNYPNSFLTIFTLKTINIDKQWVPVLNLRTTISSRCVYQSWNDSPLSTLSRCGRGWGEGVGLSPCLPAFLIYLFVSACSNSERPCCITCLQAERLAF